MEEQTEITEKSGKTDHLSVAEITFAIPAQSFGITCWISTEETLPVVTEFALRTAHVCGSLTPAQLQAFFGFSSKEVAAVIRTLEDEKLIRWDEDHLMLTPYALGRFLDSSDSIPRFFKISEWSGEVVFDLIGFGHARKPSRLRRTNAMLELLPRDQDKQSKTLYWAERSFQENFRKIMRKDRVEIYKVSEVEAGERFMIPLPCTFNVALDERLGIARSLQDELFEGQLEVAEAISDALSTPVYGGNEGFDQFITIFGDGLLGRYMKGSRFELRNYIEDVHVWHREGYSGGSEAILGALYLQKNRRRLAAWTRTCFTSQDVTQKSAPRSACWLVPQTRFWGRSPAVRLTTDEETRLLRGEITEAGELTSEADALRKNSGVKAILQSGGSRDSEVYARVHRNSFPKLFLAGGTVMNGQCELFIVPDCFICAVFHYQIDQAIPIPIGFISSSPVHISAGTDLVRSLASGQHQIRSARPDEGPQDVERELSFILGMVPDEQIPPNGSKP